MPQPANAEGKIAIVGGGPAGACMALILAQRGFSVDVFELRADPRKSYTKVDGGCVSLFSAVPLLHQPTSFKGPYQPSQ